MSSGGPIKFWRIVIVVVVLVFLLNCMGFFIPGEEIVFELFVGWVGYIRRVRGQVQVRWDMVHLSLVFGVALLAGSHLFLRWAYRGIHSDESSAARKWRFRWTAAAMGITLLMFTSGISAIALVHQTTWLVRSPVPLYQTSRRHRIVLNIECSNNLRQIGQALVLYAQAHDGKYPDDLGKLYLDDQVAAAVFVCPASNDQEATGKKPEEIAREILQPGHCSYIYLGKGMKTAVDGKRIVALDRTGNHENGVVNVLFGDGHAETLEGNAEILKGLPMDDERAAGDATRP